VGRGVGVAVSVGDGVNANVVVGSGVLVKVIGAAVSVVGMFVDVESGCGGEEAGLFPELHAEVKRINIHKRRDVLFFMA